MYLSHVSSENVIGAQRGPAKFRFYLRRRSLYAIGEDIILAGSHYRDPPRPYPRLGSMPVPAPAWGGS